MDLKPHEVAVLQGLLGKAADHYDPAKPEATYDIDALAGQATALAGRGIVGTVFSDPALIALIQAALALALQKLTAPKGPKPDPGRSIPGAPPPSAPPIAPVVDERIWPAALTVDLDLFLAEGVPAPYRVVEHEDCYEVIKTDGTTNLPIHGGAYLHAGYLDAQGKSITFEPGSHLDHTAVWTMRRVGGRLSVFCGPGNPAKEGGDRDVANFRLAEYERTRGMDVPAHFPPAADNTVSEVVLSVDTPNGTVTSKPVRFPKVS